MSPSLSRKCYNYFVLEAGIKCRNFLNFFFSDSHIFFMATAEKKRKQIMAKEGKLEMNQLNAGAAENEHLK